MKETQLTALANLLKLASLLEIATGLSLMIFPSFITHILLNSELAGAGVAVGRVAGFGLFSLGIACWPNSQTANRIHSSVWAMLMYGILITVYLIYLGVDGQWVGWGLWPAVFFHSILTLLIARIWTSR